MLLKQKEKGVIFGRPSKKYSTEFLSILQSYSKKELNLKESLLQTDLNKSNFFTIKIKLSKCIYINKKTLL